MKILITSLLAVCFAFSINAQSKLVPLQGEFTGMTVTSNTGTAFTATLNISEIALSRVLTPEGYFTRMDIPSFSKRYDNGRPAIPVFSKLIETPGSSQAQINIISYDVVELGLEELGFSEPVMPSQPSWSKSTRPEDITFYFDEAYYQLDLYSQGDIIRIEKGGEMRGVEFGNLVIDPIRYNALTNKVEIYQNLTFEIVFDSKSMASYNDTKSRYYSPMYSGFYKELPNFTAPAAKDAITEYPIKYVIVADRMFETVLQPFIEWKTEKGFTVIEAYTDMPSVGTTTTSIKSYLQGLYTAGTPSDPAPTYILFVGDVAQIPAFNGQSSGTHVTDLYYACYGGASDNIPDVYYGRFSAQNVSQLQPQIDKTLMYETYNIPNPTYLDTVVMVAGVDASMSQVWANGQINYGTSNYFNTAHGIYSHTYLYPTSSQSWVDADMRAKIGAGVGYANYTAHCSSSGWADPSFSTSDIANLNNANQYGLIVGNCCQSVKFEESASFGEAIMRAANEGAVGYIGASDYSYWDEDYYWGVGNTSNIIENPTYAGTSLGAYDKAFHDHGEATSEWFIANGQMVVAGNIAVEASTSTLKKYYWEEYHLMGDPSVMNYFSVPDPLTISYSSPMMVGNTSLVVTTEPYTYVALSLNGVLLDAQYSGTGSTVTLTFSALPQIDTAKIVATKQNKIPHIADIPIEDVQVALDAQMLQVIKPQSVYTCTGIQETPRVVIRNRGMNTLTQLNILYRHNGGSVQSTSWTGNLATMASDTVDLPAITINAGTNTFKVYTGSPNGGSDLNLTNDTLEMSFNASNVTLDAEFTVSDTAFCGAPATVVLSNLSSGATSYLWDFGNGSTSTETNPALTYNSNGLYTLTLIADAGICGADQFSIDILVGATPPVISDTSSCGAAAFNLTAIGSNLFWYDALSGGNLIATGNSYSTPLLNATTTYYVCSENVNTYFGGKIDNSGTGGYFTSTTQHGIIFDCFAPVTLKTVKLYAGAAGSKTISLYDGSGTLLDQIAVDVISGENTVSLDFDIPVGTGLKLQGPASPNLYRNGSQTGPSLYPLYVGSVIEMTGSTASGYETQFYYYFYNWEVEEVCQSVMIPVVCEIFDTPATSFSYSVTGADVSFTNSSSGGGTYLWDFGDGSSSSLENPSHTYTASGTYWVVLTQINSCGTDVDSMEVSVEVSTGLTENAGSEIQVFPNPATENCIIHANSVIVKAELFDSKGALVYQSRPDQSTTMIPVSDLPRGMYYIRIITGEGIFNKPLTLE